MCSLSNNVDVRTRGSMTPTTTSIILVTTAYFNSHDQNGNGHEHLFLPKKK